MKPGGKFAGISYKNIFESLEKAKKNLGDTLSI